jgi:peptidoglycan hydrolase-like protein with peptidoglycan-binding domain
MDARLVVVLLATALAGAACGPGEASDLAESGATTSLISPSVTDSDSDSDHGTDTGGDADATSPSDTDTSSPSTSGTDTTSGTDGKTPTDNQVADTPADAERWDRQHIEPSEPGDRNDEVEALQMRLADLGFAPGTSDGSYGPRTEKAVEAFQGLVDLPETGVADTETISALLAYRYDGPVLHAGDEGPEVEELQERLASGPFNPGPIDGEYGSATITTVWALEKLAGVPVDGDWGPLDEKAWQLVMDGKVGHPTRDHDQRWVEVDLSDQLVKVYDPGSTTPVLVSHASSGSGIPWSNEGHSGSSVTPTGDFHINRRISGWRESSLNIGRLYNPLYFNGGIAFHGALSVPLYPASHGCVRLPMHIAEVLPDELPNGTPVHVMD